MSDYGRKSNRSHPNSGRGEVTPSIMEMSPLDQHKPFFSCVLLMLSYAKH
jgi:hypothetical protein